MNPLERSLPQPADSVLLAVGQAAEAWGADWQPEAGGGRLRLPVVQGLRHGIVDGTVSLSAAVGGTTLRFAIEATDYQLNRSALVILVLGALGGLSVVFWPLSPTILHLAPVGAVLALVAWLMVVSRLRNSSAEDFFDLVEEMA